MSNIDGMQVINTGSEVSTIHKLSTVPLYRELTGTAPRHERNAVTFRRFRAAHLETRQQGALCKGRTLRRSRDHPRSEYLTRR